MSAIRNPAHSQKAGSFRLVSLCFFLSGMAGLIYQMVWMRYLSTVFGTSELAIVAVLVAYMGGLAAGASIASKFLHRLRSPIIAYAILEVIIALAAIAVPLLLNLAGGAIRTVLWATGFRPDYSWLDVPVLDRKGYIMHDGGVADAPGMYLVGMPFLRRRKSSLIDGAGDDARDLSDHLAAYVGDRSSAGGFTSGQTSSASKPQHLATI